MIVTEAIYDVRESYNCAWTFETHFITALFHLPNHPYLQDPLYLDKCITCWEQEWEDCFEVQEFAAKEGFIFKAEDMVRTRQWFR